MYSTRKLFKNCFVYKNKHNLVLTTNRFNVLDNKKCIYQYHLFLNLRINRKYCKRNPE